MQQLRVIDAKPRPEPRPSSAEKDNEQLVGLMTVAEIAGALRLTRKAVYELLWSGAFGYVRIGRRLRIPRAELLRFLRERLISPSSIPARRGGQPTARTTRRAASERIQG